MVAELFDPRVCWIAMSVSMEVVQGMMAEMQKQNAENLSTLARQQFDASQLLVQGQTRVESAAQYHSRAKLLAYLRVAV